MSSMKKRYEEVKKNNICDEQEISKLQLLGKSKYVKSADIEDIKKEKERLKKYANTFKDSISGSWTEQPPPPPSLPSDCVLF